MIKAISKPSSFAYRIAVSGILAGFLILGDSAHASKLINISTRLKVETGDNVLIGGFVIQGVSPRRVVVRATGPSLANYGVTGVLADPTLEIHDSGGNLILSNDNWKSSQQADIQSTTLAPVNDHESAIVATLSPGSYTAIVRGVNNSAGVALVEVYDIDSGTDSKPVNISTRGKVQTGDNVMIGGFVIQGTSPERVIVRATGPSLANYGVSGVLADPFLELHDSTGATIQTNVTWQTNQSGAISASGFSPSDPHESAIIATLNPGSYTAIVRGNNATSGVGLVEVYELPYLSTLASGLTFNDGTTSNQSTGNAVGNLVTDSDTIYWFDYDNSQGLTAGAIRSVPKAGGTVTTLASGLGGVNGLVSDGSTVFWEEFNISSGSGSIKSVSKGGGAVTTLATGFPPLPGGGTSTYDVFFPTSIAVDSTSVYWGESSGGGAVRKVAKTGGAVTDIGRGLGFASALNDGTNFYEVSSSQIRRMPMAGGAVTVLATFNSNNPFNAFLDSDSIYWVETADPGNLYKLPKTGGTPIPLVSGLHNPHNATVDSSYVYYPDQPGAISRVPKAGGTPQQFYSFGSDLSFNGAPPIYVQTDSSTVYVCCFNPNTNGVGKIISLSK